MLTKTGSPHRPGSLTIAGLVTAAVLDAAEVTAVAAGALHGNAFLVATDAAGFVGVTYAAGPLLWRTEDKARPAPPDRRRYFILVGAAALLGLVLVHAVGVALAAALPSANEVILPVFIVAGVVVFPSGCVLARAYGWERRR
jgi:purine-cytosine permease-like protein